MVVSCSAFGCTNKWSRSTSIHFHKFPFKNEALCAKWVSAMKRKDFSPTTASIVCSDHFKSTDYIRKRGVGKRFLRKTAVPTKFNFPSLNELSSDLVLGEITLSNRIRKPGRGKKENTNWELSTDYFVCEIEPVNEDAVSVNSAPGTIDSNVLEEDPELVNADEEDKCYILGSIWGERLKLLPLSVRPIVRQVIDRIFEEARAEKLTDNHMS